MNKKIGMLAASAIALYGTAQAETVYAIKSGDWSDETIWATKVVDEETQAETYVPYGGIPTMDDTVIFNSGVEVNLTSDVDINKFGFNYNNAESAVLNISGPDGALYMNSAEVSDLYYGYKLEVNLTDGAKMETSMLNWGSGGYYKFNVDASTFYGQFDQFNGSAIAGKDGTFDSGVYFTNGSEAVASNAWVLGKQQAANHHLTMSFDASTLTIASDGIEVSARGENASTKFIAQNSSTIAHNGKTLRVTATNAGATSEAVFDNSVLMANELWVETSGANSAGAIASATLKNMTEDQLQLSNRFIIQGNAAGATAEINIVDSNVKNTNGLTLRAINGGNAVFTIDNSTVVLGSNYLEASNGSTNLIIKNGSYVTSQGIRLATNNVNPVKNFITIYGEGSKLDLRAQGSNSIEIGSNTGERTEGKYVGLVFGGYENGQFVAADAGAFKCGWEFKARVDSSFTYLLGASNALTDFDKTQAILDGRYLKPIDGQIYVDFTNVVGLEAGYYKFALMTSDQSIADGGTWTEGDIVHTFDWNKTLGWNEDTKTYENITETEGVQLVYGEDGKCYEINDNTLYINVVVSAVPEPATWAAIFGAAALAIAARRRRARA